MAIKTLIFSNLQTGSQRFLVHCLYLMSPLNHKRTTSSLAPPIFYVAKKLQKKDKGFPILFFYLEVKIL